MKYIIISSIIFLIIFIYSAIKLSSYSDNEMLEEEKNIEKSR